MARKKLTRLTGMLLGALFIAVLTVAAVALSKWLGLSSIVIALLLGILFSGAVSSTSPLQPVIGFCADPLMKIGVACLGASVNLALLAVIGGLGLATVLFAVALVIAMGLLIGHWLGQTKRFSLLAAGAVAICGSSAALALCCVLPKSETRDRDLATVIVSISVLSSIGLLLYPVLTRLLGLSDLSAGFVMGGSLHNVAQAIAAGLSISPEAGETALVVKMTRVTLLVPLVIAVAVFFRSGERSEQGIIRSAMPPLFLIAFLTLMALASVGLISERSKSVFEFLSKTCLLLAMTAIGLSTPLRAIVKVDKKSLTLIVLLSALLLGFLIATQILQA